MGSSTFTIEKRRSIAGSFAMNLLNSSVVVAPIRGNPPRERAGFSIFAIESLPEEKSRWISSMKTMILSRFFSTKSSSSEIRFSNEPRYSVPPTREEILSSQISVSGRRPFFCRSATASTIAVFPLPAGPIIIGLLLFFRPKISIIASISRLLPKTGSILPSSAAFVRFLPKREIAEMSESPFSPASIWRSFLTSAVAKEIRVDSRFISSARFKAFFVGSLMCDKAARRRFVTTPSLSKMR